MFPLGWLNQLLGLAMNGIDWCMYHLLGVHNVGWCIVIFTLFVYILMYPLNAKQQKSSRLMNKINPEIKSIQKKYKNKKDQASQMKMNQETQDIYAKYGISPFGGCLPLLITMPILFALYNVIRNIPYYVNGIGSMKENPEAYKFLGLLVNESPMSLFKDRANYPYAGILVFLIPILAMVLQFINTKLLQVKTDAGEQDQMQSSMKMMNYMMPVMSGFFCLSFDVSIGIYWIIGSLFRIVQAILINRKVDSISLDELIEKNKGKATKKSAKREAMNRQMEEYAKKENSRN
ncbi:MAG: YidC/Oxa1 family membrane protein insertase [Clostridium sp.]